MALSEVLDQPGTLAPPTTTFTSLSPAMVAEFRSSHVGERVAVDLYHGILTLTRDPILRDVAEAHLASESVHFAAYQAYVPVRARSRLMPLWRALGFLLGAIPALIGPQAVYRTIDAVESWVDGHYADQVRQAACVPGQGDVVAFLTRCRDDEADHQRDAAARVLSPPGPLMRVWLAIVEHGCALGVAISKRI